MPKIALPRPAEITQSLSAALAHRHSYPHAGKRKNLSPSDVGTLLGAALAQHADSSRRPYPSGGALYPVETYLCGPILEGYPRAVFHYHPRAHALEHLWDQNKNFIFRDFVTDKVPEGHALIVFTAVWDRTSAKYGNLGYSHALIEAGHMAQNVLLTATSMQIGARPVAGYFDAKLESLLDLDPEIEQIVYAISVAGDDHH